MTRREELRYILKDLYREGHADSQESIPLNFSKAYKALASIEALETPRGAQFRRVEEQQKEICQLQGLIIAQKHKLATYGEALRYIVDHAWVNQKGNTDSNWKWINEFVDVAKEALK